MWSYCGWGVTLMYSLPDGTDLTSCLGNSLAASSLETLGTTMQLPPLCNENISQRYWNIYCIQHKTMPAPWYTYFTLTRLHLFESSSKLRIPCANETCLPKPECIQFALLVVLGRVSSLNAFVKSYSSVGTFSLPFYAMLFIGNRRSAKIKAIQWETM